MNRPVVVFGEDWGRHPSSTQHLVARLAADHDIIWINSIGLRRPRLNLADLGRVASKLRRMILPKAPSAGSRQPVPERMSLLSPRVVSWPGSRIAAFLNRISLTHQIRAELARRRLSGPIFFTSLPSAISVMDGLPDAPVVYYCGDDFGALEGVDHQPVLKMEVALAKRADLIFAASETLAERFDPAKTVLLPHGVDLELFQTQQFRPADLPLKGRIAGFYGSLSSWIDLKALALTAQKMPDWNFVLIGPQRVDVSELKRLRNVFLLGEKPHEMLPAYVQHWDVSLLPFRDTPQIQACNPLKLREYLATGTPVVSTSFRALAPYADLVQVTPYGCDYSEAILRAADDRHRDDLRRQSVVNESWDRRAGDIADCLKRFT